jgi:competence protein ComGC
MKQGGLTLVDVIVIVLVVGVLAVILLPAILPHRMRSSKRATCSYNLKVVALAFRTWSIDNRDKYPMSATNRNGPLAMAGGTDALRAFQVMSNELNNPRVLLCRADERNLATNGDFSRLQNSNLSYFVGLDASELFPSMILSGDRNLETNGVAVGSGLLVITQTNGLGFTAKMHNRQGNLGLADGSVQQVSRFGLQTYISRTETKVTRLGMP